MSYVGCGQGEYIQETTYKYVGCGGDYDSVRPRRDFTCIITVCCLLSLLLLIPLLCWLLSGMGTTALFDCNPGVNWVNLWSQEQQEYCCATTGVGCATTIPATATLPPTPPTTPGGPVDPFNCAVGAELSWGADKKAWCCRVHGKGCPTQFPTMPPAPAPPADPYNCADGFANWQVGWSVGKKAWCCRVHGKGCPGQGNGCAPIGTTAAPYDCNAGFANWMAGWSMPKKQWCCQNAGKGCPPANGGCA